MDADSPEINSLTDTTFYSSNSVRTPMAPAVSACNGLTPKPLNLTTTEYDHLKVEHVLEIIKKLCSDTPTVFGMNFQVRAALFGCCIRMPWYRVHTAARR